MTRTSGNEIRIFNWGWYGFENYGDDLLQKTMAERLLASPNVEICFAMNTQYKFDDSRITQCRRTYCNMIKKALYSDCLIVGPGGLFPFQNTPKCLLMYLIIIWWTLLGKKIVFFGIGVAPRMNKFNAILWRSMIKRSELFMTRSDGLIEAVGLKENARIQTMVDAAFASRAVKSSNQKSFDQKKIGIAVANISDGIEKDYKELIDTWSKTVNHLVRQGFNVDLIAFTKGADDMLIHDILHHVSPEYRGGISLFL